MKKISQFFSVCALGLFLAASFVACGDDDDDFGVRKKEDALDIEDSTDIGNSSGKQNGSSSSGKQDSTGSSSSKGKSSSSYVDTHYSAISLIDPKVPQDSVGSYVDSRDEQKYGTLRVGPYIWMTSNLVNKTQGLGNVCYDNNDSLCQKNGRLYFPNGGSACPGKFRVPTRSEWKYVMDNKNVPLVYSGSCKMEESLVCSGMGTEAYYLTRDDFVYTILGESGTTLFKKANTYGYYSQRCMAFTYIVHTKSDLPTCDSSFADVDNSFYVANMDSAYICYKGKWSLSSYKRCGNVVDTTLLYTYSDSVYICKGGYWNRATIFDTDEKCDSTRLNVVVNYNDVMYACLATGWEKLTYPSTELGLCIPSVRGKMDSTSSGYSYVCDSTGWRTAGMTDYIGNCDSTRWFEVAKYSGTDYVCRSSNSWTSMTSNEKTMGVCSPKLKDSVAVVVSGYYYSHTPYKCNGSAWVELDRNAYLDSCTAERKGEIIRYSSTDYICKNGSWSTATRTDSLGVCDSTTAGTFKTHGGKDYICKNGSWSTATRTDSLGVCDNTNAGTLKTLGGIEYVCKNKSWAKATDADRLGKCDSSLIETVKELNDVEYMCRGSSWTAKDSLEKKFGFCSEKRNGDTAMVDTTIYECMRNTSRVLKWQVVDKVIAELGKCTTTQARKVIASDGATYSCSNGVWHKLTIEEMYGRCTFHTEYKEVVYMKRLFVCDSSIRWANSEWHGYDGRDSIAGHCNAERVGTMVKYRDTSYICFATKEKGSTAVYDRFWDYATQVEVLGQCTSSREGELYNNGSGTVKCTGGRWVSTAGTFTDSRDGHVYHMTKINGKTWMADNLNYADVDSARCAGASNLRSNCTKGFSYPWHTRMKMSLASDSDDYLSQEYDADNYQGICPDGWRIPSVSDWEGLIHYIKTHNYSSTTPRAMDSSKVSPGIYLSRFGIWRNDYNSLDTILAQTLAADVYGFNAEPTGYNEPFFRNGIDYDVETKYGTQYAVYASADLYKNSTESVESSFAVSINPVGVSFPAYAKKMWLPVRCIKKD
ncbi:MAG: hypothetical protein K6E57_01415 [Fibrobacter sp.]|nr:hypothetical protein [Fibrobacter sp.]